MAIASLTEAFSQYDNNLRWWESSTKRGNLLEAVLYLLGHDPASISLAGRAFNKRDLETLRRELTADVKQDSAPAMFARARVTGTELDEDDE